MPLSAADLALVADLRERLTGCGDLRGIYLFGPRSRGATESDLDLCLVFALLDGELQARVEERVWQVGFDHGATLCPLFCSAAEFAAAATPILARIRDEGVHV